MKFELIIEWHRLLPAFREVGIDPAAYREVSDDGPFPVKVTCRCEFEGKRFPVHLKVFDTLPWARIEFDVGDPAQAKRIQHSLRPHSAEDRTCASYESWNVRQTTRKILGRHGLTFEGVYDNKDLMPHECLAALMDHFDQVNVKSRLRRDIICIFHRDAIAPEDRLWVARWMAKHLAATRGANDGSELVEQFANGKLVLPGVADDFIAMLRNRRCAARDGCLFDLFVQTRDRRVLEVAVSVLHDEMLTEAALRCIGRRKARQHADHVRKFLTHAEASIRRQAKKTMKQLGFDTEPAPAPIHLLKKRTRLPKHFREMVNKPGHRGIGAGAEERRLLHRGRLWPAGDIGGPSGGGTDEGEPDANFSVPHHVPRNSKSASGRHLHG